MSTSEEDRPGDGGSVDLTSIRSQEDLGSEGPEDLTVKGVVELQDGQGVVV